MAKFLSKKGRRNLEIGQSLVEMTVGFVILVIIVSGLLDLGRLYFIWVALEDAAGEAALYLSINVDCGVDTDDDLHIPVDTTCDNPNNAMFRALHASEGVIAPDLMTVTMDYKIAYPPPGIEPFAQVGDTVKVTIAYPFQLVTPVIPRIAGVNPITLTVIATQTVISE